MKKVKKSTELVELDVEFISLVNNPANGFGLVIKSVKDEKTVPILKTDDSTKTVYGIVYAPDKVDLQGEFARSEAIKTAAYNYMKNLRLKNVDVQHDFNKSGSYIVESWIVKKSDELFPELVGAWAVGLKVEDEKIWTAIKSGKINGLSLAGTAEKQVKEKGENLIAEFLDGLNKIFKGEEMKKNEEKVETDTGQDKTGETDKTIEEFKQMLAAFAKEFQAEVQSMKEQIAALQKSAERRKSVPDDENESGKKTYKSILGGY